MEAGGEETAISANMVFIKYFLLSTDRNTMFISLKAFFFKL